MLGVAPGSVKITLDGDRDTHDALRVHRDGRGTFDEILGRLREVADACPELRIAIGGNLRAGAAASCDRLVDRLLRAGLGGRVDVVQFKPVIDVDAGGCPSACGAESEELERASARAVERGLARRAVDGVDAVSPCALHWQTSFTIDPAGRLYRCLTVAGRPEMSLGTVDGAAPMRDDPLTSGEPWRACGDDCPFVPVCLGGCLGGKYVQLGRTGERGCDRAALERRFSAEIARRYLEEFHPGAAVGAAPAVPEVSEAAA